MNLIGEYQIESSMSSIHDSRISCLQQNDLTIEFWRLTKSHGIIPYYLKDLHLWDFFT